MEQHTQNTTHKTPNHPVVVLTDAAIEKVRSMMAKEGKDGYALRVGVVTGGCAGLSYEMKFQKNPYDNDKTSEQNGLRIIVNEESVSFLQGIQIDYVDTLKESGFKYKNPNASSSCGCGTSFS
ncbi:MAG: iron-sulfur cluster assembly accessory protein [Candidatus Omnitrophica bacterium]|nr:iron-sulfur cluster assembly accessory protein [Candidatus Omnitrophota bacterium]